MRREVSVATGEEADQIASRAVYDEWGDAHIMVTRTLSVGTSTVWLEVERERYYSPVNYNVPLVVEFGNSEECTLFLHEHMSKLHRYISVTGVAVIDDIVHALIPIIDDLLTAQSNAAARCLPYSQFVDDLHQPETQLIRHRSSNRGDERPCYLTRHISFGEFISIHCVDWNELNNSPACPLRSDTFRSLNNIHLNFLPHTQHDYHNHDRPPQHSTEPTNVTVETTGIHDLTATN
ncbi:hypothetical protein BDN71DRAFT_1454745, partial [Pleurotus eryngii]